MFTILPYISIKPLILLLLFDGLKSVQNISTKKKKITMKMTKNLITYEIFNMMRLYILCLFICHLDNKHYCALCGSKLFVKCFNYILNIDVFGTNNVPFHNKYKSHRILNLFNPHVLHFTSLYTVHAPIFTILTVWMEGISFMKNVGLFVVWKLLKYTRPIADRSIVAKVDTHLPRPDL